MNNAIEEIKKRIDIVEFIGSFITLKKAGRNFKALCPFHQEKTPSFVVSPDRQIWHCFGSCNEGGDIIKFLMKWENITFIEALRELAEKAGVKLQRLDFEDKAWDAKERLMKLNYLAAEFFNYVLFKTKYGEKAIDYLVNREINTKIAQKFQLGYAPSSWESLTSFLKNKKFDIQDLYNAGLIVKGNGGRYYDRFRGRLMFPIKDARGNVIGFAGRTLDFSTSTEAKYINTPETSLYHKRESLYGIDLAKESIKKQKNVFLVEGEFDVISPYQHGIENIVAIKGSAVTKDQLMLIKRYTNHATLMLDADNTGEDAIKRGIDEAKNMDFEIEVVQFDFAKDPDEAVRKDLTLFRKTIKKSVPVYDFTIQLAQKRYPQDDPYSKKKIGDEVLPYVEQIENPIVQSHYVKKIAQLLGVGESSITQLMNRLKQKKKERQFFVRGRKKADETREINIQRYVLSILFQSPDVYIFAEKIFRILTPEDFYPDALSKIASYFADYKKTHQQSFSLTGFSSSLSPELQATFDEIYLYATYDVDLGEINLGKLLHEIKKNSLKRQITQIVATNESPEKEEEKRLKQLSDQLKEIEKKALSL